MTQRSPLFPAAAALCAAAYVAHAFAVYYVSDDGFISFRYAQNLLRGHGLVYNIGERVEGYTNFLWVMLLAGLQWLLPHIAMPTIAQVLGVSLGAATVVFVNRFAASLPPRRPLRGLLAAACLAAHTCFAAWGTGGLESTLVALLLVAAAASYLRHVTQGTGLGRSAFYFGLATMTRPDAALLFGVTTLHLAFTDNGHRSSRWRQLMRWGGIFAIVFVPYYLWRLDYYGYLLPNTFYAKVGHGWHQYVRGARYLAYYVWSSGVLVFLPVAIRLSAWPRVAWRDYLALSVAAYAAYIVYVGGDGLSFYRFVAFIAPMISILLADGLVGCYDAVVGRGRVQRWMAATLVGASVLLLAHASLGPLLFPGSYRWREAQSGVSFPGRGTDHSYYWFDNYFVDRLALAARWLQADAPATAVVAATPAGSIAYYMDLRVIDMLGLTDATIAHAPFRTIGRGRAGHEKGHGAYVLSRQPDYILLGNVAVLPDPISAADMARKLIHRSEREIWAAPEFHRDYEHVIVKLNDTGVFRYFTFYRRKSATVVTLPGD